MKKMKLLMRLVGISLALLLLFTASACITAQAEGEGIKEEIDEVIENVIPSVEPGKDFLGFDPALFDKEPREIIEILKGTDCIVQEGLSTIAGCNMLDDFLATEALSKKSIKLVKCFEKTQNLYFSKVEYDGEKYIVSTFSLEDLSDITIRTYRYLISGEYVGDVYYVLVNDEDVGMSDIFSVSSEKPGYYDICFLKKESIKKG